MSGLNDGTVYSIRTARDPVAFGLKKCDFCCDLLGMAVGMAVGMASHKDLIEVVPAVTSNYFIEVPLGRPSSGTGRWWES